MRKKARTPQELGVEFQDEVQKVFETLQKSTLRRLRFHRFYDSRSAGGYLPAQPGDFLLCNNGKTVVVEVKLSTVYRSLHSAGALRSLMKAEQAAQMALWTRAGAEGLVIFKDHENGYVELWDGAYVAKTRATERAVLDPLTTFRFPAKDLQKELSSLY